MARVQKQEQINNQQPNVFTYEDVGSFLKDWIQFLKKKDKLSLRELTEKTSISFGYLSMVLNNKRRISSKAVNELLLHLKLSPNERKYISLLQTIEETDSPLIRIEALGEMAKISSFKKSNQKEFDTYKYLSKWYYVAIREMVLLPDFNNQPEWIHARLKGKISLKEASDAIEFLEDRNLIAKDNSGNYFLPNVDLNCKEGVYKISLGEFHRQVLDLAFKSIHEVNRDERYLLGRTVAISKADFLKAKEIYDQALAEIEKLGKSKNINEHVYHFELAAFPMTEAVESNQKKDKENESL